jgi:carbonic anhydrase/acetyltransferase-like protein (isoleucine patch superfamily)
MLYLSIAVAAFFAILLLPSIPSAFEVLWPRDDVRLNVPENYVRDPRYFGRSFRNKISAFVRVARNGRAPSEDLALTANLRTEEEARWSQDFAVLPGQRRRGIIVGDRVAVGAGAGIRDAYAIETLSVGAGTTARTLTSDGTLDVGENVRVLRWLDADGDVHVGRGTDLGLSASGGGAMVLESGVQFDRVWGQPVRAHSEQREFLELAERPGVQLVDRTAIAPGKSPIIYGSARVVSGTHLPAHLKVHGDVYLEPNVSIAGNLIVRGDVHAAGRAVIGGHLFAEGAVTLGPRVEIGRAGSAKTLYATGKVAFSDANVVWGWVVSEHGGYVR